VRWNPDAIAGELRALGFSVDLAEHVSHAVEGEERPAIDARIRAQL